MDAHPNLCLGTEIRPLHHLKGAGNQGHIAGWCNLDPKRKQCRDDKAALTNTKNVVAHVNPPSFPGTLEGQPLPGLECDCRSAESTAPIPKPAQQCETMPFQETISGHKSPLAPMRAQRPNR
jgi:hypothetical protein